MNQASVMSESTKTEDTNKELKDFVFNSSKLQKTQTKNMLSKNVESQKEQIKNLSKQVASTSQSKTVLNKKLETAQKQIENSKTENQKLSQKVGAN